jgi:uncharacterized protein (DUF2249 family)
MNSKYVMMIVVIGGFGLVGLLGASVMYFNQIPEERKAVIRTSLEVADHFKVEHVNIAHRPAERGRTLRILYETSDRGPNSDQQREEMESIAKFAWEKLERRDKEDVRRVDIQRTYRSARGCFRTSWVANHSWEPPPLPPMRGRPSR